MYLDRSLKIEGKGLPRQKRGEHLFHIVAHQARRQFGIKVAKSDIAKVRRLDSTSKSPIIVK